MFNNWNPPVRSMLRRLLVMLSFIRLTVWSLLMYSARWWGFWLKISWSIIIIIIGSSFATIWKSLNHFIKFKHLFVELASSWPCFSWYLTFKSWANQNTLQEKQLHRYLLLVQCLEFYSLTIWLWLYSLYKSWSFVTKYKFYVQNFVNLLRKLFPKFW